MFQKIGVGLDVNGGGVAIYSRLDSCPPVFAGCVIVIFIKRKFDFVVFGGGLIAFLNSVLGFVCIFERINIRVRWLRFMSLSSAGVLQFCMRVWLF
ncbi:hypothetical protein TERTU_2566 [Teredinibacter turnerae T7901]|uniref:Uncharacterized protein n=1 Tax=Teredinibacter turnerae (strain ATCC 39867 / T7901) TaxID=377629 RepID=C5BLQ6_TERTT|nr:hypothetical protein TERTU_2566 [Teredinibacter turnerae T7901]